jgi:hypothetical protein
VGYASPRSLHEHQRKHHGKHNLRQVPDFIRRPVRNGKINANAPPAAQKSSIATYAKNLQESHSNQIFNNQMPNTNRQVPEIPMMAQDLDDTALKDFYNPRDINNGGGTQQERTNHALEDFHRQQLLMEQYERKRLMILRQEQDIIDGAHPGTPESPGHPGEMAGSGGIRPEPSGSKHALHNYQVREMMFQQQKKRRLMMDRQDQDIIGGTPPGTLKNPSSPDGPNGQLFADI